MYYHTSLASSAVSQLEMAISDESDLTDELVSYFLFLMKRRPQDTCKYSIVLVRG